jgi:hypothetical protein
MPWQEYPTGPQSPIRVGISDSFDVDGIAVIIGLRLDQQTTRLGRVSEFGSIQWEEVDPLTSISTPTIRLSHDIARGLLDALLRYYGGAPDSHTVRADLMHERGRVDKMLETLLSLASRPNTREG